MRGLILIGLLAVAPSAQAQSLKLPTIVFGAAATADWVTTAQALHAGAVEGNPTINWIGPQNTPGVVGLGVALDVVGVWALKHYWGKDHPRLIGSLLYIGAGWRIGYAVNNVRVSHHPVVP